jgi:hypothetical protein
MRHDMGRDIIADGGAVAEPKQYVVARVEEGLARDVGELDVHAKVVGDQVFLRGTVATPERHLAVSEAVSAMLPGHRVHNEVVVTACDEDPTPEELA